MVFSGLEFVENLRESGSLRFFRCGFRSY